MERRPERRPERGTLKKWWTFPTVMLLFALAIARAAARRMWPVAALIWVGLRQTFRPGWHRSTIAFALIILVILESAIFAFMIGDNLNDQTLTGQETLIVPGAGVHGRELSPYLQLRVDEAVRILEKHPRMPVIVTGYQAEGALISEARAMKGALMAQGIPEARIFEEDQAPDTIRNFEYSAAVIAEQGLAREVIIVTNEFHSFRCSYLARRNGLVPVSLPVDSPITSLPWPLLREAGAWLKVQLHVLTGG